MQPARMRASGERGKRKLVAIAMIVLTIRAMVSIHGLPTSALGAFPKSLIFLGGRFPFRGKANTLKMLGIYDR